jgi:hypothetical protein
MSAPKSLSHAAWSGIVELKQGFQDLLNLLGNDLWEGTAQKNAIYLWAFEVPK